MARPTNRRPSQPAANSQTPILIGIGGIAAVVVAVILFSRGGGEKPAAAGSSPPARTEQPASAPVGKSAPAAISSGPKAGKTPTKPPPALTAETLGKLRELLAQAKVSYNAGVTARNGGDNSGARDHQAKARDVLDQWKALVQAALDWQDEANLDGWAMPGEYVELEKAYGDYSKLLKQVRMGGGQ